MLPTQKYLAPVLAALTLLAAVEARASVGVRWTDAQLAAFSEIIVSGRVTAVTPAWDTTVDTIYTYVTLDVSEVLKGWVPESQIVIKQIGGVVGDTGLRVTGQAQFAVGEDVIVFLEVRPRDATLYTAALWQGKWRVGSGGATRLDPDGGVAAVERRSVAGLRQTVMSVAGPASRMPSDQFIRVRPVETPVIRQQPYALFDQPFRWTAASVGVDYEAGGQPGLAGGGPTEIAATLGRWNAVNAGIQLAGGTARAAKCTSSNENSGRIVISFMDDCGEISNSGGTLAVGGAWLTASGGGTVNGVAFGRATDGFVMNNDSSTALDLLTSSGCFADIQLHELGHVLGLDHSSVDGAIMEPFINNSCFSAANNLHADDQQGLLFIYPGAGPAPGGTPGTPTNVQVAVNGTASLTVTWIAPASGAAPTSYRVDFSQTAGGPVVASVSSTSTAVAVLIPAGTVGTFFVTVTALNGSTPGTATAPVSFTIGSAGPTPCVAPPEAPTGVMASVSGGIVTVSWTASAGAASYIVQAGAAAGGTEIYNANVGATTVVTSPVSSGFFAFVQIRAVNACGTSGASSPISFAADPGM